MRCVVGSNATYLGVRDFFKQLVARQTSRPPTLSACRFASTQSEHQLPMEVYFSEGSPLSPSVRFDWRLRATSRPKGKLASQAPIQQYTAHKGYVKRVAPPYIRTQLGDEYFEEIQAYNARYVHWNTLQC